MKPAYRIYIILSLLLLRNSSFCQQSVLQGKIGFTIGDQLPNLAFRNLVNSPKSTLFLNDLRGKIVILDFWGLWCGPCVRVLPDLDSLQRKFGKRIAIILIDGKQAGDNAEKVLKYFKAKGFILPSVVQDTLLLTLFPHRVIPHDVWIDPSGKLIATTAPNQITENNISRLLIGKPVNLRTKYEKMDFDPDKPLFLSGNGGRCDSFLFRSMLTREIPGIPSVTRQIPIVKQGKLYIKSFQMANGYFVGLYNEVLKMGRGTALLNPSRIFLEDGSGEYNPWDYRLPNSSWLKQPLYCYSLDIPEEVRDSIFYRKYMLEDLNRYFNADARIETRIIPSLVIKPSHLSLAISPIETNRLLQERIVFSNVEQEYLDSVINLPFKSFVGFLTKFYYSSPPIFDESGIDTARVSMALNFKYEINHAFINQVDVKEWNRALNKYGLCVTVEERPVEVIILKDIWNRLGQSASH